MFNTRKNDSGISVLGSSEEPNKLNCGGLKSRNFDVAQCKFFFKLKILEEIRRLWKKNLYYLKNGISYFYK
jgi:hypothetical protein